ncbi:hypothetical protein ACO22_06970 [Paracoccidioides brasiliensis]|uniref:Uncharacterized protein n=1 Tax=Paracoccidioides brasiliensis TaxID=121759 RepID=A0A1D2J635_PARBR|nr:hypothetical protein ACO22_06970 [Paracoccidioides brasiliensis]
MTGSTRVASRSVGCQQANISLLIPRFAGSGGISRKKNLKDKDEARSDQQSGPFQSAIRLCRMISSAPQILELPWPFWYCLPSSFNPFLCNPQWQVDECRGLVLQCSGERELTGFSFNASLYPTQMLLYLDMTNLTELFRLLIQFMATFDIPVL